MRIQGSNFPPNKIPERVLHIAKLELAFLLSKECVSFWNAYNSLENMGDPPPENKVLIAIQVGNILNVLQIKLIFSLDKLFS